VVTPATGAVVLVPFPFSDLSQSKLRPAVVLADAGRGDWILYQITSKPYGDSRATEHADRDFRSGSLRVVSYARPGKLFTANQTLMVAEIGQLYPAMLKRITETVALLLRGASAGSV